MSDSEDSSTSSNAPTTQLSHLNIGYNPESRNSDSSISNQAISNQSYKDRDSADGRISRMSGSSCSSSSSQPKTTDGQKGSHKSVESSSSYKDSEETQVPSQKRKRLPSASERHPTSPIKQISNVDSHAIEPNVEVEDAYLYSLTKKNASNRIVESDDEDVENHAKETTPKPASPPKIRRSSRRIAVNPKYAENTQSQKKQGKNTNSLHNERDLSNNEDYTTDENALHKSTMLFDRDADVAGQNMFPFRTPKKKDAMANLAASTPKAPRTPCTPKHRSMPSRTPNTPKTAIVNHFGINKTPKNIRSLTKKKLVDYREEKSESEGSDFSANEDSDYEPDGTADFDDDKSENDNDESGLLSKYAQPIIETQKRTPHMTRSAARKEQDFIPESDGYFSHHANKKITTSDSTLDRLKTPRLPHDQLFGLLASMKLSEAHEQAVADMNQDYQQNFPKWMLTLNEGYNILLHGLGSKRNLMQSFHETVLRHQVVLVVNGFFPSLTIKDILDNISGDILNMALPNRNVHEIVDAIDDQLSKNHEMHIFMIVHNIDGFMLRNNKAQLILSRLARLEQIHLIASLDHINAPMLWDHTMLCNYKFAWWDVSTFLPYTEETALENSMMVNNSGGLALSAMKNVFLSLTNNSRGTFLIIVNNQINNKGNSNFQGMPFKDLYSRCREDFLVSSDVALRSQLTEFIDHNLVKMKRTPDGTEHLTIPLEHNLLQQFVEEQENW